jgi:hypothetical protein
VFEVLVVADDKQRAHHVGGDRWHRQRCGRHLAHDPHTLELSRQTWAPRQCRTFEDTWDQKYWNRPGDVDPEADGLLGTAVRGGVVPRGGYRVESRWSSAAWDNPPRPLAPVTSEPFTLLAGWSAFVQVHSYTSSRYDRREERSSQGHPRWRGAPTLS